LNEAAPRQPWAKQSQRFFPGDPVDDTLCGTTSWRFPDGARFLNETRAVNRIEHPGLVQISDCGETEDGSIYIVMELLRGATLGQRIKQRGRLGLAEVLMVCRQVSSALVAVHDKGIVHRDLGEAKKPGISRGWPAWGSGVERSAVAQRVPRRDIEARMEKEQISQRIEELVDAQARLAAGEKPKGELASMSPAAISQEISRLAASLGLDAEEQEELLRSLRDEQAPAGRPAIVGKASEVEGPLRYRPILSTLFAVLFCLAGSLAYFIHRLPMLTAALLGLAALCFLIGRLPVQRLQIQPGGALVVDQGAALDLSKFAFVRMYSAGWNVEVPAAIVFFRNQPRTAFGAWIGQYLITPFSSHIVIRLNTWRTEDGRTVAPGALAGFFAQCLKKQGFRVTSTRALANLVAGWQAQRSRGA
jgi:hypothetical protein